MNTHTIIITDIHQDVLKLRGDTGSWNWAVGDMHTFLIPRYILTTAQTQHRSVSSLPGKLPPPSPRIFFGRDELIKEVAPLRSASPIVLIGARRVEKVSISLTALHDDRFK